MDIIDCISFYTGDTQALESLRPIATLPNLEDNIARVSLGLAFPFYVIFEPSLTLLTEDP